MYIKQLILLNVKVNSSFNILFCLCLLFITIARSQSTSTEYKKNNITELVVFHDIKTTDQTIVDATAYTRSYKIEVSSPLTNGFVPCYANVTGSRHQFIPKIEKNTATNTESNYDTNKVEHYYNHLRGWTHTYGNFEMEPNSGPVTVKISLLPGVSINGFNTIKEAVEHPAEKAKNITISPDGKSVTFTIDNPCQVTIDINGTMDKEPTSFGFTGTPRHTISIFANPIIEDKPAPSGDPNVAYIENGVAPGDLDVKKIVYFKPGMHNLGLNYKIKPNTKYYIPGDAIVYGTFNTIGQTMGEVKFYGSGTISGDLISHFNYKKITDKQFVKLTSTEFNDEKPWKLIYGTFKKIDVIGLNLMNCPMHTANTNTTNGPGYLSTFNWIKIVTWRGNGDGIGSADLISNSFIRTQDDCTYVKGDRNNLVLWTDVNGTGFMLAGMHGTTRNMLVQNCDVIYARHIAKTWAGGRIFSRRAEQSPKAPGVYKAAVTFKDIRVTDPFQTLETFQLETTDGSNQSGGYEGAGDGIRFINISTVREPIIQGAEKENSITAWSGGQWKNLTFCNVKLGSLQVKNLNDFNIKPDQLQYITDVKFNNCNLATSDFLKEQDGKVKVYLDNKSKVLTVSVDQNAFTINKLEIINISGQTVYSDNDFDQNKKKVNVASLATGVYIVKLYNNTSVYNVKTVKQ